MYNKARSYGSGFEIMTEAEMMSTSCQQRFGAEKRSVGADRRKRTVAMSNRLGLTGVDVGERFSHGFMTDDAR